MAFTAEQIRNAAIIYRVGQSMGLGTRDIQIALITAMVESNLRNVNYGDRDSLGLFQQRPSQGWGTPEQVLDPEYAARKFYSTMQSMLGQRRFTMPMGDVAQAVQRSAYPGRYAERIGDMRLLWPQVQKGAGDQPLSMDGSPYLPDFEIETPTPSMSDMLGATTAPPEQAIPNTSVMLGAWGMDSPQIPETPELDPMESGLTTFLSQGTNDVMQESYGPYGQGVDGWRKAVISAAKSAVGTPYVWGGNSLSGGVDCSGLIQQAFARAGLDLPRVSYQQANFGQRVGLKALQPGDLVAWDNSSRNNGADHIAIYLGGGMIIEAPRPGLSVRIRKLGSNEGAWGVHLNF